MCVSGYCENDYCAYKNTNTDYYNTCYNYVEPTGGGYNPYDPSYYDPSYYKDVVGLVWLWWVLGVVSCIALITVPIIIVCCIKKKRRQRELAHAAYLQPGTAGGATVNASYQQVPQMQQRTDSQPQAVQQ